MKRCIPRLNLFHGVKYSKVPTYLRFLDLRHDDICGVGVSRFRHYLHESKIASGLIASNIT